MITDLLTDDQMWEMLGSPDVPSNELATRFGISPERLRSIRHAVSRNGWCCRVEFLVCDHCGEPLARSSSKQGRLRYHPACRQVALKTINNRLDRQRWERAEEDDRQRRAGRFHAYTLANQALTAQQATNRGKRWEPWEDDILMAHEANLTTIALELGRSLFAVCARRKVLLNRAGRADR